MKNFSTKRRLAAMRFAANLIAANRHVVQALLRKKTINVLRVRVMIHGYLRIMNNLRLYMIYMNLLLNYNKEKK